MYCPDNKVKQKAFRKKGAFFSIFLFFLAIIQCYSIQSYGDIYYSVDTNGVLHFTNAPTSSDYQIYIKEPSEKTSQGYETNQYDDIILKASKQYQIDFSLLKALIKVESDFNPNAVSQTGAKGLMQIMPDTVKHLKIVDPFNPTESIMGGAKYLKTLLVRFDAKLPLALAAYNAGPTIVARYQTIPPFKETEAFVNKVMNYYRRFR